MRGKYSPTVSVAYMRDRNWFRKYCELEPLTRAPAHDCSYDPEGFDSYGYDKDDIDRAGNHENDYIHNNAMDHGIDDDYNYAYDTAYDAWGFDGTKPVKLD